MQPDETLLLVYAPLVTTAERTTITSAVDYGDRHQTTGYIGQLAAVALMAGDVAAHCMLAATLAL